MLKYAEARSLKEREEREEEVKEEEGEEEMEAGSKEEMIKKIIERRMMVIVTAEEMEEEEEEIGKEFPMGFELKTLFILTKQHLIVFESDADHFSQKFTKLKRYSIREATCISTCT